MAIEAGRAPGWLAVDETTLPTSGPAVRAQWRRGGPGRRLLAHPALGPGARFDAVVDARRHADPPAGDLGHLARDGAVGRGPRPDPDARRTRRAARSSGADLHGLAPNKADRRHHDRQGVHRLVPNSRIEDLREAAAVVPAAAGHIAANVKLALVVPGSGLVKAQAEREGLDAVFKGAGFEWREPGCSMCLAMNADRLEPGERCASTSNHNFPKAARARAAAPPGQPGDGPQRRARRAIRRRASASLWGDSPMNAVRLPRWRWPRWPAATPSAAWARTSRAAAIERSEKAPPRRCSGDRIASRSPFRTFDGWSRRWTARTSTPTPSSPSSS